MDKEDLRPLYNELQGYLDQAPKEKERFYDTEATALQNQVNASIEELTALTGDDYTRYKVFSRSITWNRNPRIVMDVQTYRTNLAGLISRLYGKYFVGETAPLEGVPTTVINQTQHQQQTISIQMLLDFQSSIEKKISEAAPDSAEKSFLEKIKSSIADIRNMHELVKVVLQTGKEMGMSLADIQKLFT